MIPRDSFIETAFIHRSISRVSSACFLVMEQSLICLFAARLSQALKDARHATQDRRLSDYPSRSPNRPVRIGLRPCLQVVSTTHWHYPGQPPSDVASSRHTTYPPQSQSRISDTQQL